MRALFISMAMCILAGCSHSGTMRDIDASKPRSVLIEPFGEYDSSKELYEYAGIALARRGYDATTSDQASYRLRSSLSWNYRRISLAVRLVDASSGQVVYFGECDNPGFGTLMSNGKAMESCFTDALAGLR